MQDTKRQYFAGKKKQQQQQNKFQKNTNLFIRKNYIDIDFYNTFLWSLFFSYNLASLTYLANSAWTKYAALFIWKLTSVSNIPDRTDIIWGLFGTMPTEFNISSLEIIARLRSTKPRSSFRKERTLGIVRQLYIQIPLPDLLTQTFSSCLCWFEVNNLYWIFCVEQRTRV